MSHHQHRGAEGDRRSFEKLDDLRPGLLVEVASRLSGIRAGIVSADCSLFDRRK